MKIGNTLFLHLIVVIIIGMCSSAAGLEFVTLITPANTEPYAFINHKGVLTRGIIKDIGDSIAKELGVTAQYMEAPRKRFVSLFQSGEADGVLVANPAWYPNKDEFFWSEPLFAERDVIVMNAQNTFSVKSFDDLKAKRVGTILGFHYPKELQEKFNSGIVIREDVENLEQNMNKLKLQRIDCLIFSDILVEYYLKQSTAKDQYVIAEKVVEEYNVRVLLSKKSSVSIKKINSIIKKMRQSGAMDDIIARYR